MSPTSRAVLSPRMLGAHAVAVVLVAIAVGLGFWQLGAWSAEREAAAVDLTQEAPVPLGDVMTPDDGFPVDALGRPVEVTGQWVPEGTLVVTGRSEDTESAGDGVWAVTPVAVDGEDGAELLVVRGWAASADELPEAPSGAADLVVRPQPSQAEPGAVADQPGDRVLPQLRIADAVQLTDADLYGGYAVAAVPEAGLAVVEVPEREEVGPFTALQNLLYSVEWWVFGAFAAFVWWRFVRDAIEEERAVDSVTDGDPDDPRDGGRDLGDDEPDPAPVAGPARTPVG